MMSLISNLLLINAVYSSSDNDLPENNKVGLTITENEFIDAVTAAFETVEHMRYENPTVTNEKLKYIYAAAKKNSESTSKWANEQLIQFTATACHNMYGLNQFNKGDATNHGPFVGIGLMQFWGEGVYKDVNKTLGQEIFKNTFDYYTSNSINLEYKYFIKKYFTPMHNNKEATTNLNSYLQTIHTMAYSEGQYIKFDENGDPYIDNERLTQSEFEGQMVRRLKYYAEIKKRLNTQNENSVFKMKRNVRREIDYKEKYEEVMEKKEEILERINELRELVEIL